MSGHPRVIIVETPPKPEKHARRASQGRNPVLSIAASIVVLALVAASGKVIWTYVTSTAASLRIDGQTVFADDLTRAARAQIATTVIVQEARNEWARDPGGLVFAFRTSDLGYYSGLPFLSNLDTQVVPFLEIEDPQELWKALREHDFRLVLQPGYPWPEVNNTAFDALLADPRYATLAYAKDGMRLLRIRPEISQPSYIVVGDEGESGDRPLNASEWKSWSWPTSDIEPTLTQSAAGSPIHVEFPQRLFADRERWDYTERGIPGGSTPPAFKIGEGILVIDIDVEGRGRVDAYAVHQGPNSATGETLIWSGTLLGERRTIAGQMSVPQEALIDAQGRRHMGLRLRTFRSAPLTIHGWRARWLPHSTTRTDVERLHFVQQGPAERDSRLEARVLSGEAKSALHVQGTPLPTRAVAVCSQGDAELVLSGGSADRAEAQDLPCWPRVLVLEWPSGSAPSAAAAQLRVIADGGPVQTLPLLPLQEALARLAHDR